MLGKCSFPCCQLWPSCPLPCSEASSKLSRLASHHPWRSPNTHVSSCPVASSSSYSKSTVRSPLPVTQIREIYSGMCTDSSCELGNVLGTGGVEEAGRGKGTASACKNKCLPPFKHVHVEEEMATHSSILAWRIPWMEEPGRLQSMGLQRVGHD